MTTPSKTTERENEAALLGKLMYVCACCADNNPEGCGHYNRNDLREWPEEGGSTIWLCKDCYDSHTSEDLGGGAKPVWSSLPIPPAATLLSPAPTPAGEGERREAELKAYCVAFFRWWHNQPGTNTEQSYDDFAKSEHAPSLALRRAQPPQQTERKEGEANSVSTNSEQPPADGRHNDSPRSVTGGGALSHPTADAEGLSDFPTQATITIARAVADKLNRARSTDEINPTMADELFEGAHRTISALLSIIDRQSDALVASDWRVAEAERDRSASVFCVMRGSHREARDMARARFVALNPDEREQASRLAKDADLQARAEAAEACVAVLEAALKIGDRVQVSDTYRYKGDWRGWTGFICGIHAINGNARLSYDVCDEWPPNERSGRTDGFEAGDLVRAALSTGAGEEK